MLYSGLLRFVCASRRVRCDRFREFAFLIVVQLATRRTEEVVMDEALWCVTYGVLWWWVVLMMRDGAWRGPTSADNGSGQETADTTHPHVSYRFK